MQKSNVFSPSVSFADSSLVRESLSSAAAGRKKTEIVLAFLRGMCYNNNENHY